MKECYEVKNVSSLTDYINQINTRESVFDNDYQLETNGAWIYELQNGEVVFIPNNFRDDGFLFKNKNCFKQIVESDRFPIENPDKDLFDAELDQIKTINKQNSHYRNHLNSLFGLNYRQTDRDALQEFMKKVVSNKISMIHTDLVALIVMFGEVMKKEVNGRWLLEKTYGVYNPYYVPHILNQQDKVIQIGNLVLIDIKWNLTSIDSILNDIGVLSLEEFSNQRPCFVLTD